MKKLLPIQFSVLITLLFSTISFTSVAQQYVWGKAMGGTGYDHISSSAYDAAGNVYVTGSFTGTVDFNRGGTTPATLTATGTNNIFVAKYTATGDYVWSFMLGGVATGNSGEGTKIVSDASGNITVAGYYTGTCDFDPGTNTTNHTAAQYGEMFMARYTTSKLFMGVLYPGGGSAITAMTTDAAGSVYIAGTITSLCDFSGSNHQYLDPAYGAVFIAKYSAAGAYLWGKNMAPTTGSISAREIAVDAHSNIYLTGSFAGVLDFDPSPTATTNLTPVGVQDTYFAKYDAQGDLKWAHNIGCSGNATIPKGLAVDPANGSMYLTGSHWTTIDLDPGPGMSTFTTHGNYNAYMAKYDSMGVYVWGHSFGGASNNGPCDGTTLAVDAVGNVMLGGNYMQNVDFDPGPGTATLLAPTYSNIFVAKYKSNGDYLWAKGLTAVHPKVFNPGAADAKITLGPSGALYVSGTFSDTVDFAMGATPAVQVSAGHYDAYVAKYKDTTGGLGLDVKGVELATSQMVVYPTPAKDGGAVVKYDLVKAGAVTINVYDMSGRLVQSIAKGAENVGVHTQALNAGLATGNYLIQLRCDNAASVTRLVITE